MHSDVKDVSIVAACRSRDEVRLIQQMMVACGLTSYFVRPDLKSSLDSVVSNTPDVALLVCDKDVARMREFVSAVRSRSFGGNRYLPIIVALWHPSVAQIRQAIDLGANEIVSIPANTDAIRRAIYRAVFVGRPFIDVDSYFGPCRRRKQVDYGVPNRRKKNWEYSHISVRPANVATG